MVKLALRLGYGWIASTYYIPANTLRNNNVVITSKRRRFDVITTLLLRHVFRGIYPVHISAVTHSRRSAVLHGFDYPRWGPTGSWCSSIPFSYHQWACLLVFLHRSNEWIFLTHCPDEWADLPGSSEFRTRGLGASGCWVTTRFILPDVWCSWQTRQSDDSRCLPGFRRMQPNRWGSPGPSVGDRDMHHARASGACRDACRDH